MISRGFSWLLRLALALGIGTMGRGSGHHPSSQASVGQAKGLLCATQSPPSRPFSQHAFSDSRWKVGSGKIARTEIPERRKASCRAPPSLLAPPLPELSVSGNPWEFVGVAQHWFWGVGYLNSIKRDPDLWRFSLLFSLRLLLGSLQTYIPLLALSADCSLKLSLKPRLRLSSLRLSLPSHAPAALQLPAGAGDLFLKPLPVYWGHRSAGSKAVGLLR